MRREPNQMPLSLFSARVCMHPSDQHSASRGCQTLARPGRACPCTLPSCRTAQKFSACSTKRWPPAVDTLVHARFSSTSAGLAPQNSCRGMEQVGLRVSKLLVPVMLAANTLDPCALAGSPPAAATLTHQPQQC